MTPPDGPSKALATWLALVGGGLGLHRFYLHGAGDRWAWLHLPPTLVGAWGFWRLRTLGTDDALGAMLVPLLGAMLAATMLTAIVYGLTPAKRWQARFASSAAHARTGWAVVVGVVLALALGATAAMATIAFTAQRAFEGFAAADPATTRTARG